MKNQFEVTNIKKIKDTYFYVFNHDNFEEEQIMINIKDNFFIYDKQSKNKIIPIEFFFDSDKLAIANFRSAIDTYSNYNIIKDSLNSDEFKELLQSTNKS